MGPELSRGQESDWHTDWHTHTQTPTQATTIPEGQNWSRVKIGLASATQVSYNMGQAWKLPFTQATKQSQDELTSMD